MAVLPTASATQESGTNGSLDPSLPVAEATRASDVISLDGHLDDVAWREAAPITSFTQIDPFEGEPGSERTEVRILYDDDALYVGALLYDRSPLSTRLGRRDAFLRDSDWFIVSLDSYDDNRTAYRFQVNPSGVRSDEVLSGGQDHRGDDSWDPVWQAATARTETGWSAELRIPFSQLRFRRTEEQVWGVQLTREIARNREQAVFSFTPKDERAGIARYGHLVGIREIEQKRGLEVLPYVLGRAEYLDVDQSSSVDFANPYRDGSEYFSGAGLDVKYRLSSNLTVDAAVNPDFGQVEVDPAVVNLTAFETRFQEKRPFFVEGADIFGFGGRGGGGGFGGPGRGFGFGGPGGGGGGGPTQLLYSRRIGRSPQGDVPDEAVYQNLPEATTILSAAKLTGRTAGGWSVGFLEAVTAREMADYTDESFTKHRAEVAPLTNYFAGRLRRDFRDGQSAVGGIATAVNRELSDAVLANDLRSSAYTGGIDFFHEWADREWSLSGHVAASRISGTPESIEIAQTSSARYFQRPDAGHVELDPEATSMSGYTASAELSKQAGLHWRGNLELSTTSPAFEVNDLGFQRDADRRRAELRAEYQENRPGNVFRRWEINASPEASWNHDGDRLESSLSLSARGTFLNYWYANLSFEWGFAGLNDRLTRGGPLARSPARKQITLFGGTDFSKPYSGRFSARHEWNEAGGRETSFSLNLGIRPSSTWDLSLGPQLSLNRSLAQYVDAVVDPLATSTFGTRYVFADLEQTTLSMETRLNVTFRPGLTLEIFAQPFLASGDYGTLKELRAPRTFDFRRYGVDVGTSSPVDGEYVIDPDGDGPASSFSIENEDFNHVSLRGTGVLRWEWRPGSTLFLVWQQHRSDSYENGDFRFGRDADAMLAADAENVLMFKVSYWLSP